MDLGKNGQSVVVRQLVKLPIIDRVKVVKDIMMSQLATIHSQVQAIHSVAKALLDNDSPLLESSITLVEAVQRTHLDVDRHSRELLDNMRQARREVEGQTRVLLDAVQRDHAEARQQERLLLETLRDSQESARDQIDGLLDAVRTSRTETAQQEQLLLDTLRRGQDNAQHQAHWLREAMNTLVAVSESVAQQGSQIGTAVSELQGLVAEERQLLREVLERSAAPRPAESPHDRVILLPSWPSPEEPEVGLMVHLYSCLPSRTAVDIGANVGNVSSRLLEAGFEVFAFEPHPTVFYQLSDRFSKDANFHCFPWAVGSSDDSRSLHIASETPGSTRYPDSTLYSSLITHSMPDGLAFTGSVTVTVRSLESLHHSEHVPAAIGLVKIDTEGFDLEVIRGMGTHRYSVVIVEYWDEATPFGASGAMNRLDDMIKEMRRRDYHWYIVFYRVWGKEAVSFYCNHERSVENAFGNVFFFRDYTAFAEALKWCSAVLPVTYQTYRAR
jgi:FkbM family methyltransferase